VSKRIYNPLKLDVAAVTLLAVVTGSAWMALRPMLSRSADESRAASSLVKERRNASDLSRQLAMAQTELRSSRRELETLSQPAWGDLDRSRRIEGLYRVARESGLKLDGINPGEPETTAGRRGLSLRLAGRGKYAALTATLAAIRQANPDMVIRSIDLSPAPNSATEVGVNAEILWVWPADAKDPGMTAAVGGVK
jgi:hypothetical protein